MGHPKKQRKKTTNPFRPYYKERIEKEKNIMRDFGLRRKSEIRVAESHIRNFRRRARELQAVRDEKKEKALFDKLLKLGLIDSKARLEDILEIQLEHILSRRLQTIVHKKGHANTVKHARQLIVHGHVLVNDKKLVWPGYFVTTDKEKNISVEKGVVK
jgi:small subunit ribosomal protein S4